MTTKIKPSVLEDTTVTPGTYGGGQSIPIVTIDQQGRITAASNTSVGVANTQITGVITPQQIANTKTYNISISGTAARATIAGDGSSFITDTNIALQSVNSANTSANSTSSIGYNQTYTNVTSTRTFGTTYTNSTGKPILLVIYATRGGASTASLQISVNGAQAFTFAYGSNSGGGNYCVGSLIIPNGQTYNVTSSDATLSSWVELR